MKRVCRPLICFAVLLLCFSRSAIPAASQDVPADIPPSVAGRRQLLGQLIAERERARSIEDRALMVQLGNRIVELYLKLYEFDSALTESNATLVTARELTAAHTRLLVQTLISAARVHISRTESPTALTLLNEAYRSSVALGDRKLQAQVKAELALACYELDQRDDAITHNNDALQLSRELQDKRGEARALVMRGDLLMLDNNYAEAVASLKAGAEVWRSLNDSASLANALVDQNFVAIRMGQWNDALVLLSEASPLLVDREGEPYLAGKISTSFGEIYEAYGQLDTALSYYREALTFYRDGAHDVRSAAVAGTKVGRVLARLNDFPGARQQIQQSLTEAIQSGNTLNVGLCHEDLGRVELDAGDYQTARREFQQAIDQFGQGRNTRPLARAQTYLGQTEHLLGNLASARQLYESALAFFSESQDYTNEAALRYGLGKVALAEGRFDAAEEHLHRSLELTKLLRENASSKDLRSSFLDSVHDRYETYVEWLMTRYDRDRNPQHAIEAFEVAESGRAQSLLDSLNRYQRELRKPSDPSLLLEEERLQKEEQKLLDETAAVLSRGGSDQERAAVEQKLKAVQTQSETLEARIDGSTKFNDLLRPRALTYEQIKSDVTDDQTSLVSFSLGAGKSFAWVLTKDGLTTCELADKKTIEVASNELIKLLKNPPLNQSEQDQLQNAIDQVSRLVVEPLADKLKTARLIIVADGVLHYVPFNILHTSTPANEPLIAKFDLVEAPSASALAVVRRERLNRRPGPKLLIGFGDAVFSSAYAPHPVNAGPTEGRASAGSRFSNLPPLFNAKRELRSISELAGPNSSFYVEYNATREKLLNVDLSQYRILHVVTHGVLDDKRPELSGLVLSMVDENSQPISGFVSLADIYKLNAPVDLVVLSACDTALGENLRGEGLVGLTRGFMYAGAAGVVASLWKVNDKATAELMKSFYRNMLQRGMEPAAALRAAQNEIRSRPEWSAPYYWAGFTFQGDYALRIQAVPSESQFTPGRIVVGAVLLLAVGSGVYWFYFRRTSGTMNK